MSIKIKLEFQTKIDLELLSQGVNLQLIRLLGNVHLKCPKKWSIEEKVIIDTGNPISIIPHSVWQNVEKKCSFIQKQSYMDLVLRTRQLYQDN